MLNKCWINEWIELCDQNKGESLCWVLHVSLYSPLKKGLLPTLVGHHQEPARIMVSMLKDLSWQEVPPLLLDGDSTLVSQPHQKGSPTSGASIEGLLQLREKLKFCSHLLRCIVHLLILFFSLKHPSCISHGQTPIGHQDPAPGASPWGTSLTPSGTSTVFSSTPCSWCKPQTEALANCWVVFCLLHSLDCKSPAQALS